MAMVYREVSCHLCLEDLVEGTTFVALTDCQKTLCRQLSNTQPNRPDTFSTRGTITNRADFFVRFRALRGLLKKSLPDLRLASCGRC